MNHSLAVACCMFGLLAPAAAGRASEADPDLPAEFVRDAARYTERAEALRDRYEEGLTRLQEDFQRRVETAAANEPDPATAERLRRAAAELTDPAGPVGGPAGPAALAAPWTLHHATWGEPRGQQRKIDVTHAARLEEDALVFGPVVEQLGDIAPGGIYYLNLELRRGPERLHVRVPRAAGPRYVTEISAGYADDADGTSPPTAVPIRLPDAAAPPAVAGPTDGDGPAAPDAAEGPQYTFEYEYFLLSRYGGSRRYDPNHLTRWERRVPERDRYEHNRIGVVLRVRNDEPEAAAFSGWAAVGVNNPTLRGAEANLTGRERFHTVRLNPGEIGEVTLFIDTPAADRIRHVAVTNVEKHTR